MVSLNFDVVTNGHCDHRFWHWGCHGLGYWFLCAGGEIRLGPGSCFPGYADYAPGVY